MKKIVVVCMAVMMMSMIGIENSSAGIYSVKVDPGRKSNGCLGWGICYLKYDGIILDFEWGTPSRSGDQLDAKTSVDESKNLYVLSVSVSELQKKNPAAYKEMMDTGVFTLEDDIVFPNDAKKSLDLKRTKPLKLKKGTYKTIIKGDIATVSIDIE